jgi:hypothetical protein
MLTFIVACSPDAIGPQGQDPSDTGAESPDLPPIVGPDNVLMDDTSEGIEVTIRGGSAVGWKFGVAWPEQDFTDEACLGPSICHPLGANGGFVPFCEEDPATAGCSAIPQLYYRMDSMTYFLAPTVGLGCWVWGQETEYYAALGCVETRWEGNSY